MEQAEGGHLLALSHPPPGGQEVGQRRLRGRPRDRPRRRPRHQLGQPRPPGQGEEVRGAKTEPGTFGVFGFFL